MNPRLPVFIIALAVAAFLPAAARADFKIYVSEKGGDDRDGKTEATAFRTPERARDELRALRKTSALPPGPVVVEFLPGHYPRTQSLEFSAEDSGTPASPVIYRAQKPGTAVFSGARDFPLSQFRKVEDPALVRRLDPAARGQVLALSVKDAGLTSTGPYPDRFDDQGGIFELFDAQGRLPRSRWPNKGYTTMKSVLTVGDKNIPGVFEYRDDRPSRWTENKNFWLKGQWRVGWEDPALKVAAVDTTARTITFATGLVNGIGSKYKRPQGSGEEPWCAINMLEEIDQPGEWALDFTTGVLYVWPRETGPGSVISITQLTQPLVSVQEARHLDFSGLTLAHSLGDGMVMEQVENCRVLGSRLFNLAGRGVVIHGIRSGVQSCDIHDIGAGCVYISGGDRKALTLSENFVLNNHLHHYGVLKSQYSAGVHVGVLGNPAGGNAIRDALGIRIAHNCLHHAPRDAFLYSGNDNLYEYNEVYYCAFDTKDTGAWYSWLDWTMRGNVIRYNYIHDTVGGINPDDGASGNEAYGNIFKGPRTGVWIASGPDNNIHHNIFIKESGSVFGMDDRGVGRKYATNARLINRVKELNPDQEPWKSAHPELATMLDNRPELPWRTRFVGNLIVSQNPAPSELKMNAQFKNNPDIILEQDNLTMAEDPGFIDAAAGNFGLKPDSAVFQKIPGFEPIPFDKIGLQVDEFRPVLPDESELKRGPEHSPYQDKDLNYGT
ncbi:MAG: right-handed parallel beta-helix repeat-containing protein [Candidatus Methylacidiphilales bacterium]|nr:right-handed parallel beta-helix repeat-containing protein [Candidatus Methylacidiphilales bacterium]